MHLRRNTSEAERSLSSSFPRNLVTGLALALTAAGLALWHFKGAEPWRAVIPLIVDESFPSEPMQEAMQLERVAEAHEAITSMGSRFMGQPGHRKAADYMQRAFEEAGLEVYEQAFDVIVPQTAYREIYTLPVPGSEDMEPLADVEVYPLMPNQLQPMVTPGDGIRGELVLLDDETLRTRERFDDCIGLIDTKVGERSTVFDLVWEQYASLGIKALILSNSDGLEAVAWWEMSPSRGINAMVSSSPVNFVRLVASPAIFDHLGETVHLRVRSDFKRVLTKSVFGVLRATEPTEEALLVVAAYDTPSMLPDRAPGVMEAISPAVQLQLLEGALRYRSSLKRDLIFFADGANMMAGEGHNRILGLIGKNDGSHPKHPIELGAFDPETDAVTGGRSDIGYPRQVELAERWEENERQQHRVLRVEKLFADSSFAIDPEATAQTLKQVEDDIRDLMQEQFSYVVKAIGFDLGEPLMEAKVALERQPDQTSLRADDPVFQRYLAANRAHKEIQAATGYSIVNLLETKPELARRFNLRSRFAERIRELRDFHAARRLELQQDAAVLNLFSSYRRIGVFSTRLAPVHPDATIRTEHLAVGDAAQGDQDMHSVRAGMNIMEFAKRRLGLGDELQLPKIDTLNPSSFRMALFNVVSHRVAKMWSQVGYPTFYLYNPERKESYQDYVSPLDRPFMHDLGSLKYSFLMVGETFLSLAHGNGSLEMTEIENQTHARFAGVSSSGRVVAGEAGQSLVPDFPVKDALVANRSRPDSNMWAYAGHYQHPIYMTDVYGRFDVPHNHNDFNVRREGMVISPVAVKPGKDGIIAYVKDEGSTAQRQFKSTGVPVLQAEDLTIPVFRAAPVTLLSMTDPNLRDFSDIKVVRAQGLAPFGNELRIRNRSIITTFLPPDERCYVLLQAGSMENERVQVTRAFMTNADDTPPERLVKDIDGIGYLVADHPILLDMPSEVAHSMAYTNGRRLKLQNAYHMADELTNAYHQKVLDNIELSKEPGTSKREAVEYAQKAVAYAMLMHPILRNSVFEAVAGILWYLGLLVPFIFFFEKLVFAFPDVRKQLVAQAGIFLTTFLLLRILHPAFEMVRSSMMILLGFVIILITFAITLQFTSKFRENLEDLRRKQGRINAAEVNKFGVFATAFMLGLNNMHRRKMRTGLTCATLTLISFVIICFTSVKNDLVEEGTAIGKASYQGLLIRKEGVGTYSDAEVRAVKERFGDRFEVSPRNMAVSGGGERRRMNPELELVYKDGGSYRKVDFDTVVRYGPAEPMRHQIRMLTDTPWFEKEYEAGSIEPVPIFIPSVMADRLSIHARDVEDKGVTAWLNGVEVLIRGLFDAEAYNRMTDLDGIPLLPYDNSALDQIAAVSGPGNTWGSGSSIPWDAPKISAELAILAPTGKNFPVPEGEGGVFSIAVSMPDANYREAWTVIEEHMEQTGDPLYYGLDGVAYHGQKGRKQTLSGFIDLLIPLIIAALTVLNTMRGSVYERKDEIYVYNSVGIAPRYVFFMFLAEAFVYAVVGSILGYILSQGTGRILTALDFTGGLNMTFTSLTSVYASLLIFAAVLVSTYFPARSAMEIASPSEEGHWKLPEAEGDELNFDLPFTFHFHGRVGIMAFLNRWFDDHGEGGAGRFFAGTPEMSVLEEIDPQGDTACIPALHTTIWMKPFDLAVSQRLTIAMPPDPSTGEYRVRLAFRRLSGTHDSWRRLNQPFVAQLRRQFLHWRAASSEEQNELFAEGRRLLEASIEPTTPVTRA